MARSGITVFLIDDDKGARDSLELLLSTYGFAVTSFDSGEAFLDSLPPADSACLVLDIHMPGMDGFVLLNAMKERGIFYPAVMITGAMNATIPGKARQAGVTEVFEKPLDIDALVQAIRRGKTASTRRTSRPTASSEMCSAVGSSSSGRSARTLG